MTILGYGEDALTLHALLNGLPGILASLGDDTDATKALVLYRPSFGRRGSPPDGPPSSQFGEFDAIIGTPRGVYLVETKRPGSAVIQGGQLVLPPEQVTRHRAFRGYFEEWRRDRAHDWPTFAARMRAVFQARDLNLEPPPADSTLAKNLSDVLGRLDVCAPNIVDVLLFCRSSDAAPVPTSCGGFRIVSYVCASEDHSEFIRIVD